MQKFSLLVLVLILSFGSGCKQDEVSTKSTTSKIEEKSPEIIQSAIGDQEIILGSYINAYFVTPNPAHTAIQFTEKKKSACMQAFLQKKGISNLILAPTQSTDKQFITEILTKDEWGSKSIKFTTKIVAPKGDIYYAKPKEAIIKNSNHLFESITSILNKTKSSTHATIFLASGSYNSLALKNVENITLIPMLEAAPIFQNIKITNSQNITLQGLTVSSTNPLGKKSYYIKIDSSSSKISIKNCLIQAANKTESWEPEDWARKASNGIYSLGNNCHFEHNLIRNIHHGLETKGNSNIVNNNIIVRFAGDAIRNTGDDNIFDSNYLADALVDDYSAKDGNHDDLFQSWTFEAPIKHITIKNNIAISCTDTTMHLPSKVVQGIACFDGFEENWLIENNLVILEHPHGIALFGANQCQIKNNRIIPSPFNQYEGEWESKPWIMIADHKDGRPSLNNLITNNLVSVLKITDSLALSQNNRLIDPNPIITFPHFQQWIFTQK